MNKEDRRRALDHIESLEFTVDKAIEVLQQAQYDYLMAVGFYADDVNPLITTYTYQDESGLVDEFFLDTEHAMEYAEEHIE